MLVTPDNLSQSLEICRQYEVLTVDLETTGLFPYREDKLIGIAIQAGDNTFYFPFRHRSGHNFHPRNIPDWFDFLSQRVLCGHNLKFDLTFLRLEGILPPKEIRDSMLAAHLMNENEPSFALKALGDKYLRFLGKASAERDELHYQLETRGFKKWDLAALPASMVEPYACKDVVLSQALLKLYEPAMERWKLVDLFKEICEYDLVIFDMEFEGVQLDTELIQEYKLLAVDRAAELKSEIQLSTGGTIANPGSPKQVANWFQVASAAKSVLSVIDDPLAKDILEYRGWTKVTNTYYDPFLEMVDSKGVIHCSFNLHGTNTGRLSCSKPNLQQIPRGSDIYKVKNVFIARPGYTFLSCDYSQADMRIATHYAAEQNMADLLISGRDIHTETAVALGLVRDGMNEKEKERGRYIAKTINFGIIYGVGATKLSQLLGVTESTARQFLQSYHTRYPGFKNLYKRAESKALSDGYIRYWTGRVRRYGDRIENNPHKAMPNLIQGGVAEMVRVAMQRIHRELKSEGVRMLLQIHDDIISEVPIEDVERIRPRYLELMQDFEFMVPIVAEAKVGTSWGSLQKVKNEHHVMAVATDS